MDIRKKVVLPLVLMLLGGGAVYLTATSKPRPNPSIAPTTSAAKIKVRVDTVESERLGLNVLTQGTVTARRQIDLVAQVSGQVISVDNDFAEGGFFAQREALVKIDDRNYQTAYLSAKARLADAERRLAEEEGLSRQAKQQWRDLGNENANALFIRKPQLAAAKAALEFAKADLAKAQLDIDRTEISVPFDGRVVQKLVDVGQFVSAGAPVARVYDTSAVEVRLPLTEKQAALLNLPLGHSTIDSQVRPKVTLRGSVGGRMNEWQGTITRTAPTLDTQSRMYIAVAEIEDPFSLHASDTNDTSDPLLPGLFVEAEIEGKMIEGVVKLPREAVFKQDQLYLLGDQDEIESRQINVLRKTQDFVWAQVDMAGKSRIVLEKHILLSPGLEVDPVTDKRVLTDKTEQPQEAQTTLELTKG